MGGTHVKMGSNHFKSLDNIIECSSAIVLAGSFNYRRNEKSSQGRLSTLKRTHRVTYAH